MYNDFFVVKNFLIESLYTFVRNNRFFYINDVLFDYSRLQKSLRFPIFDFALFFEPHFDLINQQKVLFVTFHRHVKMMFI